MSRPRSRGAQALLRGGLLSGLVLAGAGASPARASEPTEAATAAKARAEADKAALLAERDQLIDRIARGTDLEASVRRFRELLEAHRAQLAAQKREADDRVALQKRLANDSLTLDYRITQHCTFSADPAAPPPGQISEVFHGDYGKVLRKETIQVPGRSAFDPPQDVHIYQVEGRKQRYVISSEAPRTFDHKPLAASVGDLVLICGTGASTHGSGSPNPPDLRENIVSSGFVARLAAPPRLAGKRRWNPVFLGPPRLRMAIDRTQWPLPTEQPVLTRLLILGERRDLGSGRFEALVEQRHRGPEPLTLVLEVPPGLVRRSLIAPERMLWLIVAAPRFDVQLKKLVLRVEDVEETMFEPAP